ncbi:MAG TPA: hypothetical protein VME22_03210 [Solirubrobacteraceae bacterium]|nr:hypothetical protein [Solirubrobacteraceae bacterium]
MPDICVAAISATSIVTVVSGAFTALAAVATIAAVVYARRTVGEAHLTRTESHAAHLAEIAAMEQATALAAEQHKQQISELQFAASAAYAGHEEQMAAHKEVFRHDLIVRRLVQMQRVAQVLFDLIGAAREEAVHPSQRVDLGNRRLLGATPIPALQTQLRIEVRILKALGGPDLTDVIPPVERDDDPAGVLRLWTANGLTALQRLEGMIEAAESLRPNLAK